jgi:hypothetical protein
MANLLATAAAAVAVLLFGIALVFMMDGQLSIAGLCFLSASLVIYFRATRLVEN